MPYGFLFLCYDKFGSSIVAVSKFDNTAPLGSSVVFFYCIVNVGQSCIMTDRYPVSLSSCLYINKQLPCTSDAGLSHR